MSLGGAFRVLVSELASVGLDPRAMCVEAGVDPGVVDGGGVALRREDLRRVLARAEATSGDPLLGLHMAERAKGRGVLSYLARSQRTVGEGLLAFERFANTAWGAGTVVRFERRGARAFVGFHLAATSPRHVVEYLLTRTALALPRRQAGVHEAWFQHAPAGPTREYERVLRCHARFRQRETGLSLEAADLERPLRTANPDAAEALAIALTRLPARRATTVSARLAAAVEDALARGRRADREVLARSLGMSGRTLARRLAEEQRLFRDVVDDVRRTLAERLVAESSLDLGEVAVRVGFADLAAFGKAFRRWFGKPPSAARARRSAG